MTPASSGAVLTRRQRRHKYESDSRVRVAFRKHARGRRVDYGRARCRAPVCEELPRGAGRAAAFDTRFDKPTFLTGSAAKGIAKRLRAKGYTLVTPPESFFVDGTEGPVHEGDLERAAEWAAGLREQVEHVERLPEGSYKA